MFVHVSPMEMCIETITISFESTQNKQQYGNKMTCTEVRAKMLR